MTRYKIVLLVVIILAFLGSIFLCFRYRTDDISVVQDVQLITNDDEKILLYYSDEVLYAFLPSCTSLDELRLDFPDDGFLYINYTTAKSGDYLSDFGVSIGNTYELQYKCNKYSFCVLQSANVATLFVTNATGYFDEVLNDKTYKEPVKLSLLDEYGKQLYCDIGNISGRGNSTWLLEKRPFNIYLNSDVSLLGLNASDKYCLIANGYDKSNIRNKIIYDFANEIETNWTPSCEYVDLYINGEYNGLYLLSESVEVEETKIDISMDNGFWYSMSIPSRIPKLDDYITTDDGRIVEVKYPQRSEYSKLLNRLNILEAKLKSEEALEYIDIDSWARTYLINEIFENTDICSLYFYWDSSDENNKIYAGPHWDYDNALGNAACNRVKQPATAQIASQPSRFVGYGNSWFSELSHNDEFVNLYTKLYTDEYRAIVEDIITNRIDELADRIEKASYCNSIRWNKMYDSFVYNDTVDEIKLYFADRIAFLDSMWINNDEWCSIRLNRGNGLSYYYYSVKKGESIGNLPDEKILGVSGIDHWIDESTGEIVSATECINTDRCFKAVFFNNKSTEKMSVSVSKMDLLIYLVSFSFIIFLVYMIIIDRRLQVAQ